MSEWNDKGLAIIVNDNREYLYSFLQGKTLSYGFTSIESVENCDLDGIDFTKEYNCCRVTLELSSDLSYEEESRNPNITTTMVGYISPEGSLINSMLNMNNGKIYLAGPGKEAQLEKVLKEELNELAKENMETQELLATNKNVMMKRLKERTNNQ